MNLRRACRISVKTCFRDKLEELQKYIKIPFKKSLVCFFGAMWLVLLVVSFVMDFWFYLCVCFLFFSLSKRKRRKISQLIEIIAWSEEHGMQSNFILTQRQQHLENTFSIRVISSQRLIALNDKGKTCHEASVQLQWWE